MASVSAFQPVGESMPSILPFCGVPLILKRSSPFRMMGVRVTVVGPTNEAAPDTAIFSIEVENGSGSYHFCRVDG